jgi:hypothetical protein
MQDDMISRIARVVTAARSVHTLKVGNGDGVATRGFFFAGAGELGTLLVAEEQASCSGSLWDCTRGQRPIEA